MESASGSPAHFCRMTLIQFSVPVTIYFAILTHNRRISLLFGVESGLNMTVLKPIAIRSILVEIRSLLLASAWFNMVLRCTRNPKSLSLSDDGHISS